MRARSLLGAGAVTLAAAAAGYPWLWRRACLTWGASAVEVCRQMPGDEYLPGAPLVTTRAVTVQARPSDVWPWLVQLGPGRGGAYTYDWISTLFGLSRREGLGPLKGVGPRRSGLLVPQYDDLKPGDILPLGSHGPTLEVAEVDRDRSLVLRSQDGRWIWSFGLYPRGHSTRLVSRNRVEEPGTGVPSRLFARYALEPVGLVTEQRMLLGIKRSAERISPS